MFKNVRMDLLSLEIFGVVHLLSSFFYDYFDNRFCLDSHFYKDGLADYR